MLRDLPDRPNPMMKSVRAAALRLFALTPWGVAHGLSKRAGLARDQGRMDIAAALYQEALRFAPRRARIHMQCGHMMKEMGDLAGAEHHYLAAKRLTPNNPDVALQLGHFYKVARRPDLSVEAYRRALELKPDFADAERELAAAEPDPTDTAAAVTPVDISQLAPELFPREKLSSGMRMPGIQMLHVGARHVRGHWGARVMRGVEAVRGHCIGAGSDMAVVMLIDGETVFDSAEAGAGSVGVEVTDKTTFNIWHDFSQYGSGCYNLEIRCRGKAGAFSWKDMIVVHPALHSADHPDSDAVVGPLDDLGEGLEVAINAAPSAIRSARRSIFAEAPRNVLIQRVDQLGDLVISVPALRKLRALLPDAQLVGLLTGANADLARSLGLFDHIILIDFPEVPGGGRRVMSPQDQVALKSRLAAFDFDLAIDLSESSASRPLLKLSGARFLYGFNERISPWLSAGYESHARDPVNALERTPPSGNTVALIDRLATMIDSGTVPVQRDDLSRSILKRFGIGRADEYVVLHTGARLAFSRWPHFAALVALILERTALKIVVMADDAAAYDSFSETQLSHPRLLRIVGKMSFDEFDAMLSFAQGFVGNDSGPKHLAALRGTHAVSLHMARLNWNEWGQENAGSIISRRIPCAGCAITRAEECAKDFACLRHIKPEEVFAALMAEKPIAEGAAA
ncbi:ADP-heptose:LPS heptosyltransferase [Sphingomonas zeicaulis]|uniref:glycosyltransferase family 9 protein n=1 Tax=Sphingomonas zeicaulis TaxID=1632740 RepID=UPI003D206634